MNYGYEFMKLIGDWWLVQGIIISHIQFLVQIFDMWGPLIKVSRTGDV